MTTTLKSLRITNVLVLVILSVVPAQAGGVAETNTMPSKIRNLMEAHGYVMKPPALRISLQDTNSLRNLPMTARDQFAPFELPKRKAAWKPWDNSSIRHIGWNDEQIHGFSPVFAQYEYNLTYSFVF